MTGSEVFLQQVLNGLTIGSYLALIALGYTMVYGIIELINFAHGDVYMLVLSRPGHRRPHGVCLAPARRLAAGTGLGGHPRR